MEKISKSDRNRLIGASIGFLLCIAALIYVGKLTKRQGEANARYHKTANRAIMEAGYAQGQADALKGIIRIRPINDSTYVWTSSPWGAVKPIHDTIGVTIRYR